MNDKITRIKGDIRNINDVKKAMEGVDVVVHTAAALPLYKPEDIYSTDVQGTKNLLEVAYQNKVKRFIFISSTAVYDIADPSPIDENNQLNALEHYGKAKIMAEKISEEFRCKGMCIPIIRPKSFIGPERLGAFGFLYDWAKDGKNFPIIGTGKNRYQLLDVEDLCESIYLCLVKDKAVVNNTFNIGAKEFTTMKEDFQAVLDEAGFGKKIVSLPIKFTTSVLKILEFFRFSPVHEWIYETAYRDSFVSIEKAEKQLGFVPKYSNKDALIANYKWYLTNIDKIKQKKVGISQSNLWKQKGLKLVKIFF
jgi:nucleoside-diphosphate-sugar epimerase